VFCKERRAKVVPKRYRDMQKELERNPKVRKISPELRKMHEIFGDQNADCGMAAQYEDGTCSKIVYDLEMMSFRTRTGVVFSSTEPVKEYPTQAETQAERVYKFTHILKEKKN
jgi:hypothetical protein